MEEINAELENILQTFVGVTEKSGNLKNEYKQEILLAVKKARYIFSKINNKFEDNHKELKRLTTELNNKESGIASHSTRTYSATLRSNTDAKRAVATFSVIVGSKLNQGADCIKSELKSKINPTDIKVGIKAVKTLRSGKILIQSTSKEDIKILNDNINSTCETLESNISRRKNPRLVIYNIPEEVNIDNAASIISLQNSELNISPDEIKPKFVYENRKKAKNIVIELSPEARKKIIDKKLKLGWEICKNEDYIRVNRCFKCSKYNHSSINCQGKITCPNCAQEHDKRDCKAKIEEYRCINCTNWNNYNKDKLNTNHSSLDRACERYKAALIKIKQNINY